jgi:hypothetical protein
MNIIFSFLGIFATAMKTQVSLAMKLTRDEVYDPTPEPVIDHGISTELFDILKDIDDVKYEDTDMQCMACEYSVILCNGQ